MGKEGPGLRGLQGSFSSGAPSQRPEEHLRHKLWPLSGKQGGQTRCNPADLVEVKVGAGRGPPAGTTATGGAHIPDPGGPCEEEEKWHQGAAMDRAVSLQPPQAPLKQPLLGRGPHGNRVGVSEHACRAWQRAPPKASSKGGWALALTQPAPQALTMSRLSASLSLSQHLPREEKSGRPSGRHPGPRGASPQSRALPAAILTLSQAAQPPRPAQSRRPGAHLSLLPALCRVGLKEPAAQGG